MRGSQNLGDLRAREPVGKLPALLQVLLAHFSTGDRSYPGAVGNARTFLVAIFVRKIYELRERYGPDAGLVLVPGNNFLRVIGTIKRTALRVYARTGVVTADN